jgi:hypothetical protein
MKNGRGNQSNKRAMSKGEVMFCNLGFQDAREGKVFNISRHFTNKHYALGYMEELMRQKRQRPFIVKLAENVANFFKVTK